MNATAISAPPLFAHRVTHEILDPSMVDEVLLELRHLQSPGTWGHGIPAWVEAIHEGVFGADCPSFNVNWVISDLRCWLIDLAYNNG